MTAGVAGNTTPCAPADEGNRGASHTAATGAMEAQKRRESMVGEEEASWGGNTPGATHERNRRSVQTLLTEGSVETLAGPQRPALPQLKPATADAVLSGCNPLPLPVSCPESCPPAPAPRRHRQLGHAVPAFHGHGHRRHRRECTAGGGVPVFSPLAAQTERQTLSGESRGPLQSRG